MIARIIAFELKYAASGGIMIFLFIWPIVGCIANKRNWFANKKKKIQRASWTVIFLFRTVLDGWDWLMAGKTFFGAALAVLINLAFVPIFLALDNFLENFIVQEAARIRRRFRF